MRSHFETKITNVSLNLTDLFGVDSPIYSKKGLVRPFTRLSLPILMSGLILSKVLGKNESVN